MAVSTSITLRTKVVCIEIARVARRPVEGAGVVLAAAISAVGLVVHNFADLAGQTVLSPESPYPTLLTAALGAIWLTPIRWAATWALLGWAALNLVGGGIISVLPLPILPFHPEQSARHLPLPPAVHRHADPAADSHRKVVATTPMTPLSTWVGCRRLGKENMAAFDGHACGWSRS